MDNSELEIDSSEEEMEEDDSNYENEVEMNEEEWPKLGSKPTEKREGEGTQNDCSIIREIKPDNKKTINNKILKNKVKMSAKNKTRESSISKAAKYYDFKKANDKNEAGFELVKGKRSRKRSSEDIAPAKKLQKPKENDIPITNKFDPLNKIKEPQVINSQPKMPPIMLRRIAEYPGTA
ncbi:hypothetical protein HNY73_006603 [Argiope bruennichi]|uniref:Uncharacterized protein n=1 Tax=Argiope bruennichi TaxID=94029 RepID=A0A8T0FDV8_ARGBR|nr:hypothetical protein HNY73_006603 [Argiope bruennichi]